MFGSLFGGIIHSGAGQSALGAVGKAASGIVSGLFGGGDSSGSSDSSGGSSSTGGGGILSSVMGGISSLFGGSGGKRDGSSEALALYVTGNSSGGGGLGSLFSGLTGGGSGDSSSSGSGDWLSSLIPHAAGGDVNPSSAYLVGEKGPEILTGASGRILSNANSKRELNTNSGPNLYYSIDARGADPELMNTRIRQSLIAVHSSSVATGVQVSAERMKRIPMQARH